MTSTVIWIFLFGQFSVSIKASLHQDNSNCLECRILSQELREHSRELNELRNLHHHQEAEIQKLKNKVAEQKKEINVCNSHRKDESQVKIEHDVSGNGKNDNSIKHMKSMIGSKDMFQKKTRTLPKTQIASAKSEQSGDLERNQGNRFLSFGCVGDIIPLSCKDDRTINITSAYYGQYHETCAEGCCIPHPRDECVEYVPLSSVSEWLELKATCDNKTSCDYEYRGQSFAENCTAGATADFINIYYACLPDTPNPIAFTARPVDKLSYKESDHIIFDATSLNTGDHYQKDASIFICPATGIYLFSLSILSLGSNQTYAAIKIENGSPIGTALADEVPDHFSQGAMTGFATCNKGERVWVEYTSAEGGGSMYDGSFSVFAGSLIHLYN